MCIAYKRQMEVYQWLLRQNGLRVAETGYFVYCNGDRSQADFGGAMRFLVKVIPYSGDDSWVGVALINARKCLEGDVPAHTPDCEQCAYLLDIRNLGL